MEGKQYKIDIGSAGSSVSQLQGPEIHALARLEADLELTSAYCRQCQKVCELSGGGVLNHPISGWYLDSKNRALEYAGMAIRDARNYEMNAPPVDYVYAIYKFFRPMLLSIASQLEPYRDATKMRELLETPVDEKIKEKRKELRGARGDRNNLRVEGLKEAIKALEEGKKTALLTTLFSEGTDEFLEYVEKKGIGYVSDLISGMKRESVIEYLRKTREAVYKPPLKARESANEFIDYCSGVVIPSEVCITYRGKLLEARVELSGVLEDREKINEEFKSGASFVLDVPINLLSIMSNEEFETIKKLGLEIIKNRTEGM